MKAIFGIIAGIVAVGVIVLLLGLGFGWFSKGVETVSAPHVQAQYNLVIQDWNALTTAADNACAAQGGSANSNGPTLVESPALAYQATYRNIRTEYNSAWQNIFDAKLVGPRGYPHNVPNFSEATGAKPNFCSVSQQLSDLQSQEG
jgi:hypothetical protein